MALLVLTSTIGDSGGQTPVQEQEQEQEVPQSPTDDAPEAEVEPLPPPPPPDGIMPLSEPVTIDATPRSRAQSVFVGGSLVVAGRDGSLGAYDDTGGFVWKLGLAEGALLRPVVVVDADSASQPESVAAMWVASVQGRVIEVEPDSGAIVREFDLPFPPTLSPLRSGELVFWVGEAGRLLAMNTQAETVWEVELGEPIAAVSASEDLLVASGAERSLFALDIRDGSIKWEFPSLRGFRAPVAFDPQRQAIYVGDESGQFYCLNASNGKRKFRWATGAAIRAAPLVEGDRVYVASYANTLFAFHAGNGHEQWRTNLAGRPAMTPIRIFQRLVITTLDGGMEEIQPANGRITARHRFPGEVLPQPSFRIEPAPIDSDLFVDESLEDSGDDAPLARAKDSQSLFGEAHSLLTAEPLPSELEDERDSMSDELQDALSVASAPEGPQWFEHTRFSVTLRSGPVLILRHQRPPAPVPEGTEAESTEPTETKEPAEPPRTRPPPR